MPRNKKRWINKKNTVTYELSLRSDKGEAVSVLTPIKAYGNQVVPDRMYDELAARFEDKKESDEEEFDSEERYEDTEFNSSEEDPEDRFTKPIGVVPGSVFITNEGRVLNAQEVSSFASEKPGDLLREVKRKNEVKEEAVPEDIDPEILEALENAGEGNFETFEDDYIKELMKGEEGDGTFEEIGGGYGLDDLEGDDEPKKKPSKADNNQRYSDEFDDTFDDSDDESYEIGPSKPRTKKLVDDMFDAALDRFDEDDTLEVEPDDPAIVGPSKTTAFNDIFDEFLFANSRVTIQELDEGMIKRNLLPKKDILADDVATSLNAIKHKITQAADNSEEDDSDEDWKKDLNDTLSLKVKDGGWDCESIISTYSNTENHPSLIAIPRKEDKIRLGMRGAPKLPHAEPGESKAEKKKNTKVLERKKDETPEEKRARKQEVKEARRKQRESKKNNRVAYKEEELKQRTQNVTNFTRGKTVVQYTI